MCLRHRGMVEQATHTKTQRQRGRKPGAECWGGDWEMAGRVLGASMPVPQGMGEWDG